MATREDPAKNAPTPQAPQGAGMSDYLKEAFLFRWNLLFLRAGAAAGLARLDVARPAARRAHALRAAARALPRDARHRRRRPRRGRRSKQQRRGDPDAGARSAAVAVPAAVALEGRARSVSEDDERA